MKPTPLPPPYHSADGRGGREAKQVDGGWRMQLCSQKPQNKRPGGAELASLGIYNYTCITRKMRLK